MDASKIKAIIIVVVALFAALYLGISAATAQLETVAWVIGTTVLVICISLGRRIWLLIPFMAAVDITLSLPSLPTTLLLAQLLVLGFSVVLFLMRKLPYQLRFSELEFLMILLIVNVVQVYVRNPIGVSLFGSGNVGGKSYILFGITCFSAFFLCIIRVPASQLALMFKLSVIGGILNLMTGVLGLVFPIVGHFTSNASFYDEAASGNTSIDSGRSTRIGFLSTFARNMSLWISSVTSPVSALWRPLWGFLVLISLAAAAMSGFRSAFISVIVIYVLGTLYRGGRGQFMVGMFGGLAALALLATANAIHPLPPNIQRSLAFLPGTWEERYIEDAEGSTEWRVEIWKEVLFTERWIHNKLLGDGLGFSAAELAFQLNTKEYSSQRASISGFDLQRESIISSGDYHSTAVSTIRTCGYVGLVTLIIVMFRLAVHAHRLIQSCRNTQWRTLSVFIGIPPIAMMIIFPISSNNFLQVASSMFLSLAFVRLAQNNIDLKTPSDNSSPLPS